MAITIRKKPSTPETTPAATQTPTEAEKPAPRASMALQKPSPSKPLPVRPAAPVVKPAAPVQSGAPKVIKLGSKSQAMEPAKVPDAVAVKPQITHMPPKAKYEPTPIGTRVVITNSMFPWVKHYKPGDSGVIKQIMANKDPLGISEDGSHQTHIISIDQPLDASRKGQTAALFRWEFETPERLKLAGNQLEIPA